MTAVVIVSAVLVALGLAGIAVPVLPGGSALVGAGVLVWALKVGSATGWSFFAAAVVCLLAGVTIKWLVPSRSLRQAGVPLRTQLCGAALAVVGFFVVPVVGFFIGFVLGVYAAELLRLRAGGRAWRSTVAAIRAAGLAIAIELGAALAATAVWVVGVIVA